MTSPTDNSNETDETSSDTRQSATAINPWLAYALPMFLFLAITSVEGRFGRGLYPLLYATKIAVVVAALTFFAKTWRGELNLSASLRHLPLAVIVGLVVFGEWILLDPFTPPIPFLSGGDRTAMNPFAEIADPFIRNAFLAVRFFGLAAVVPLMEELFWRSFLTRAVDGFFADKPFTTYAVGENSLRALALVSVLFAVAHPEWLVALICGFAYGWLLLHTKSLLACVVAHSVTNLALGVYVLITQNWRYW